MPKSGFRDPSDPPGEGTRDRLLAAAAGLMAEGGWSAVTTRRVADRAGLARGLVHYHFDTIEALRVAAATVAVEAAAVGALDGLEEDRPFLDAFAGAVRTMVEGARRGPLAVLFAELLVRAGRDPEIRAWMGALLASYRDRLETVVAGAIERGEMRPVDPAGVAGVLAAFVDGILLHAIADPGAPVEEALDALHRLVRIGGEGHP